MKRCFATIFIMLFSITLFAQDKLDDELKTLFESKKFDQIIEQYGSTATGYSAKSAYYIGWAYYAKEEDNNCIKFMNLSISKDSTLIPPRFYKATTLNYMNKFEEAAICFQSAINIKSDDAMLYCGLGDSYSNLGKWDEALKAYKKSSEQANPPDRAYSMIAQAYSELKDAKNALQAFYTAKLKIAKSGNSYINTLFNIGLYESLNENYDKAEPAFLELLQLDSNDYHTYAKLIQIYYHKKDYAKAKPYKDKLYLANKKGLLKDNLKDMFCFDQFKWNDKLIQVYERFEENTKEIYNKHLFYVQNSEGKLEFRIQTESSPISLELGHSRYILCMTKGNKHATFNVGFKENFEYEDLKIAVIEILEGKITPVAASEFK